MLTHLLFTSLEKPTPGSATSHERRTFCCVTGKTDTLQCNKKDFTSHERLTLCYLPTKTDFLQRNKKDCLSSTLQERLTFCDIAKTKTNKQTTNKKQNKKNKTKQTKNKKQKTKRLAATTQEKQTFCYVTGKTDFLLCHKKDGLCYVTGKIGSLLCHRKD